MSPRITKLLPLLFLAAAILVTWSNSYQAPLAFDDFGSIRDNSSIRAPYTLDTLLHPPSDGAQTVSGRPLLNLSFAFNRWLSGENYASYRVTNVLIHLLNAFLVFTLTRLTTQRISDKKPVSLPPSFPLLISLIWALHPLTTSAVSYLAQRAESLCSLFFLLTLYTFIRAQASSKPIAWLTLSTLSCYAGIATKEVMAAAPLIVLLWNWTFQSSTTTALSPRVSRLYFLLIFASWIPLLLLSLNTGDRAGTASLAIGAASWDYLQLQTWALLHYLQLALWPSDLVFDYGRDLALPSPITLIACGSAILALLITSCRLAYKKSSLGFLGLSSFLVLAPSSSIFPLTDPVFEHRFYLPLIFVSAFLLLLTSTILKRETLYFVIPISAVLGLLTYQRNIDYQDELTLWAQAIAYRPENARAQTNIGSLYLEHGQDKLAIEHLKFALDIKATPLRHHNLANALALDSQFDSAIPHYQAALEVEPHFQLSRIGLAQALSENKDFAAAIPQYESFLASNPKNLTALRGLAKAYNGAANTHKAIATFQRICQLSETATAYFDLGDALAQAQRFDEAKEAFAKTTELDPDNAQAHSNLGNLHLITQDYPAAARSYQASLALEPTAIAHTNLAISFLYTKRIQDAKTELQNALALNPDYPPAQNLIKKLR